MYRRLWINRRDSRPSDERNLRSCQARVGELFRESAAYRRAIAGSCPVLPAWLCRDPADIWSPALVSTGAPRGDCDGSRSEPGSGYRNEVPAALLGANRLAGISSTMGNFQTIAFLRREDENS